MKYRFLKLQLQNFTGGWIPTETQNVISVTGSLKLNQVGIGSFRIPANDPVAEYIYPGIKAYVTAISGVYLDKILPICAIVIESVTQIEDEGTAFIDVSGPDIGEALNYRRVGNNTHDSALGDNTLDEIMSYAPDFHYEITGGGTALTAPTYLVTKNETVFQALRQIAEQTGGHFAIIPQIQKVLWIEDPEDSDFIFSNDAVAGADPILSIKQERSGESPITRLTAYGAGSGDDRLRLDTVALTAGDREDLWADFPLIDWTIAAYLSKPTYELGGYDIREGEISFPYIKPKDDTAPELYKAVLALNRTAARWYSQLYLEEKVWTITTTTDRVGIGFDSFVIPGLLATVQYANDQYTLNGLYYMISVSHTFDAGIRYTTIQLSQTLQEWVDGNEAFVKKLEKIGQSASSTSAPATGTSTGSPIYHHALLGLTDDDHPQYLRADGGTALVGDLVVGVGRTIDGIDLSAHAANPAAHHDLATAGDGLTITGQQLNVVAGDGLTVAADSIALTTPGSLSGSSTNAAAGSHTHAIDSTIARSAVTITAGNGLTGGGDLSASRTLNVGAGDGLTVSADAIALTVPGSLSVSSINTAAGSHTHAVTASANPGAAEALLKTTAAGLLTLETLAVTGDVTAGAVGSNWVPALTDTYDLGSSTKLWRTGWLSELQSILFVENTIQAIGGWFIIPHGQGTLAADVGAADTAVDFGQSMTVDDFVIMRGNLQVEYLKIVSLASGTTYNITRNVDGSGANDWPAGQVFIVLGNSGDGRIELDAQNAGPRISIIKQGATYNAQTEVSRFGDLNGNWGYAAETYGVALGEYGTNKPNLVWDSTNGLRIRNHATDLLKFDVSGNADIAGVLRIGTNGGIYQGTGTFASPTTGLKIYNVSGIGVIRMYDAGSIGVSMTDNGLAISSEEITATDTIPDTNQYSDVAPNGVSSLQLRHTSQTAVGGFVQGYHANLIFTTGWDGNPATPAYNDEHVRVDIGTGPTKAGSYISLVRSIATSGPGAGNAVTNHIDYVSTDHIFSGNIDISGTAKIYGFVSLYDDAQISGNLGIVGGLIVGNVETGAVDDQIRLSRSGTLMGQLSTSDTTWLRINQDVAKNIYTPRAIVAVTGFSTEAAILPVGGDVVYNGDLIARRASTSHTGYIYVPYTTRKTSTSWDGDAKTTANNGTIDLSAVFSIPANVKAVSVHISTRSTTTNVAIALGPSSGDAYHVVATTQVANVNVQASGIVPCDSNGDVYFTITAASTHYVYIEITGYFI